MPWGRAFLSAVRGYAALRLHSACHGPCLDCFGRFKRSMYTNMLARHRGYADGGRLPVPRAEFCPNAACQLPFWDRPCV